jgi:hypothetical protein
MRGYRKEGKAGYVPVRNLSEEQKEARGNERQGGN